MRVLSCVIAVAMVLTGSSLAGSAAPDLPGPGTFSYSGFPVLTPARNGREGRPMTDCGGSLAEGLTPFN